MKIELGFGGIGEQNVHSSSRLQCNRLKNLAGLLIAINICYL
jgi:hypothetical protein